MVNNVDLNRLQKDKNYNLAYSVMDSLLCFQCPDIETLKNLYGKEKALIISENTNNYFSTTKHKRTFRRKHNYIAPAEITEARMEIEKNKHFQKIHSSLLRNEIPLSHNLKIFYGEYSDEVSNVFSYYKKYHLKRKCELSAATHLNRVGAVVYQLNMNGKNSHKYSAIAVMHDAVEDLLDFTEFKKDNKLHIDAYKIFLKEFIPKELQQSVKILTNHYNFIFKFILDKLDYEDKSVSLKNILLVLEKLLSKDLEDLTPYIEKMYVLLRNLIPEGNLLDSAKWECYKDLYIFGIAEESSINNDFRLFEIKGVDLSDNAHGKGSLSIDAKIRNINKNTLWSVIGYNLKSSWPPLNNKIEEIMEDALQSAEQLILSDLLQPQSSQDFVMSALHKIKKLESVFYI